MKTFTAATTDLNQTADQIQCDARFNKVVAKEQAKVETLAAKMGVEFFQALKVIIAKKMQYGAMKINGQWHPVVKGEVLHDTYTFSTAAMAHTISMAGNVILEYR